MQQPQFGGRGESLMLGQRRLTVSMGDPKAALMLSLGLELLAHRTSP